MEKAQIRTTNTRFLTDPDLRTKFSNQTLARLNNFLAQQWETSPDAFKQLVVDQNGVLFPTGSIMRGTAVEDKRRDRAANRGKYLAGDEARPSDVDLFSFYDTKVRKSTTTFWNPVHTAVIGRGERDNPAEIDYVVNPQLARRGRRAVETAAFDLTTTVERIHSLEGPDRGEFQAIACLFQLPKDAFLPAIEELREPVTDNIRHHRNVIAQALLEEYRNPRLPYRQTHYQAALDRATRTQFDQHFRGELVEPWDLHTQRWENVSQELFARRGAKRAAGNPERSSRLLVRLRQVPDRFLSPEELEEYIDE